MPRRTLLTVIAIAALPVFAGDAGLKAGLWQVRLVRQIVDGHDTSTQMAASLEQMKQAMANLPPEQRERMEAMMKQSGLRQDGEGGYRVCISPQMAQRNAPVLDREGRCQPASIKQHGGTTDFQFSCTTNGVSMSGKGEAIALANVIKTHTEVTTSTASGGTHQMQSDTEMIYLGSDCGDLKPSVPPSQP